MAPDEPPAFHAREQAPRNASLQAQAASCPSSRWRRSYSSAVTGRPCACCPSPAGVASKSCPWPWRSVYLQATIPPTNGSTPHTGVEAHRQTCVAPDSETHSSGPQPACGDRLNRVHPTVPHCRAQAKDRLPSSFCTNWSDNQTTLAKPRPSAHPCREARTQRAPRRQGPTPQLAPWG
jgi:hypothetical protein